MNPAPEFTPIDSILCSEGISDSLINELLTCYQTISTDSGVDLSRLNDQGVFHIHNGIMTPCMFTVGVRTVTDVMLGKGTWFGNTNLSKYSNFVTIQRAIGVH